MKIVVIGGSGLIGKKVVKRLLDKGHEVIAASPSSGVNAVTGEGLAEAMKGADVVVDVANSPSFEDREVLEFFEKSGKNLMKAEKEEGVNHHVALSVVGTDKLGESGYFRAKMMQEKLIRESGIPYSIVRATQFLEFLGAIAESGADGNRIKLSSAYLQPIASDDVARLIVDVVLKPPVNGIVEIAGPEKMSMAQMVAKYLKAKGDTREVISDNKTGYFGTAIKEDTLIPEMPSPLLGSIKLDEWVKS